MFILLKTQVSYIDEKKKNHILYRKFTNQNVQESSKGNASIINHALLLK